MDGTRIDFEAMPWQATAPGARHKAVERGGKRIRLVEFTSAFVEHEWCRKAHVGYVISGDLEIAFERTTERFSPGEAFIIAADGEKHKARSVGPTTVLVLVEEV